MTVDTEELIKKLSDPGDVSKPWMTARLLARKVGLAESSAHEVEESLLNYYKKILGTNQVPEIRYSSLPSKRTLEVLWGHTKFVGNRRVYELKKTDVADDSLDADQDITTADVFISHSFKDYNDVIQIGRMLQRENVKPWLAETHIQQGEHIHEAIINILRNTQCFALFLSENSLSSKWTGKEYGDARSKGIPIIVIADCRSPVIRRFIEKKLIGEFQWEEKLSGDAVHFFHDLFTDEAKITYTVIYPETWWPEFKLGQTTEILSIEQMAVLVKRIISTSNAGW